jgi:hypothetical protein
MAPEQQQQQPGKRKRTNGNSYSSGSGSGNSSNGNDGTTTTTTSTNNTSNDNDENLGVIFRRVADRRRKEVTTLEPAFVRALLLEIRSLTGIQFEILSAARAATGTPIDTEKAGDEILELIMKQYRIMIDKDAPSNLQRRSHDVVKEIFRLIGDHGGTAMENDDHHQRKKVKYVGRNNIISASAITANNSTTNQSTATAAEPNLSGQDSARVSASTNTETSRPQVSTSNREDNNVTNSDRGNTKSTIQTHPSMTKNIATSSGNKEINSSNSRSGIRSRSNSLKSNIRTVASLSAASASTTAVAIDSSNSTPPAVHPSMVRKSSSTTSSTTITAVPPPYQKRSATVLDNRNNSQNRSTSAGNAAKNKKHPPRNGENNNVPVHLSMNRTSTTAKTTESLTNNSVRSATASTIVASASTAFNAVSASSSSSSSSLTSSPRQGTVTNNTTAIPETVRSNKSNTSTNSAPPVSRPKEKLKADTAVTTVQLPADNIRGNSFAGYINIRPSVTLDFHRYLPTANMCNELGKRLLKWDPYWKVEKMLCTGLTAPVTKRRYRRNEDTPPNDDIVTSNTVATFKIEQLLKMVGPKLRQVPQGQPPRDGEFRVLMRMIPLDLSAKQLEKRADVHIWPKGTYLQVHAAPSNSTNPMPQKLIQRKQQSHDYSYWAGVCHPLDLTSLLHSSWSSTSTSLSSFPYSVIECGCHDSEAYWFSLALVKYQSPQTITESLLTKNNKTLKRLSLPESYDRAIKMMKNNEVTLDDSDDEDNNNNGDQKKNPSTEELKRIQFSLKDPLAMTVIKTPVRGSECKHFSVRFCIRFRYRMLL